MQPLYYTPKFQRHLHHLVINGFYARDLDADDFAFIESVRTHGNVGAGSIGGEFYTDHTHGDEELEWWRLHFAVERGAVRRCGPYETRAEKQARRAQAAALLRMAQAKRREKIEQDRATAAAELAAAQKEWDEQQEKLAQERERRLRLAKQADLEWEAAENEKKQNLIRQLVQNTKTPSEPKPRHYMPEWKLEEQRRQIARNAKAERRAAREAERTQRQAQEAERAQARKVEPTRQQPVAEAKCGHHYRRRRDEEIERLQAQERQEDAERRYEAERRRVEATALELSNRQMQSMGRSFNSYAELLEFCEQIERSGKISWVTRARR